MSAPAIIQLLTPGRIKPEGCFCAELIFGPFVFSVCYRGQSGHNAKRISGCRFQLYPNCDTLTITRLCRERARNHRVARLSSGKQRALKLPQEAGRFLFIVMPVTGTDFMVAHEKNGLRVLRQTGG